MHGKGIAGFVLANVIELEGNLSLNLCVPRALRYIEQITWMGIWGTERLLGALPGRMRLCRLDLHMPYFIPRRANITDGTSAVHLVEHVD